MTLTPMSGYEYRQLVVNAYDKHDGAVRQRRGGEFDRFLVIDDSHAPKPIQFGDREGDDLSAFASRVRVSFAMFLNQLGSDGWELVSKVTETGVTFGPPGWHWRQLAEGGTYLFRRRTAQ